MESLTENLPKNTTPSDEDALLTKSEESKHYFQIDAWKALMILFVIMDHTFTHAFLRQFYSSFWERISIPILLIVMGFNMGKSFKRKGYTEMSQLYSWDYFESKFKRYIAPYLILYAAHTILYLLERYTGMETNTIMYYVLVVLGYR